MRNCLFIFWLIALFLTSCVPSKKIILLQHKRGGYELRQHPTDTVLRNYVIDKFDYKIQSNDILSVRYQSLTDKEYDLSSELGGGGAGSAGGASSAGAAGGGASARGELVDENGEIPVQVVGKVKVAGMTIFQAQDTLQQIANRFLESTIVKVRLLNYHATFLGEVNREGILNFSNNRTSLMEAIGMAGGLGELADRSNIKIIRQVNNETKVFYVNVLEEDFMTSPFFYVHQNDLIIVPPLRQRTFKKYFIQNMALAVSSLSIFLLILTWTKK